MKHVKNVILVGLVGLVLMAAAAPAAADRKPGGWVGVGLLGGAVAPIGATADTHQEGLAATLRVNWTSRIGLGLELAAEYSPLPRQASGPERYETHLITAAVLPRMSFGKGRWRSWLGAGGGVGYESLRALDEEGLEVVDSSHTVTLVATGAAGLEMHLAQGVGLSAVASYTRHFGELDYELIALTGGLVLVFQ
ncbi:outer membrane beta-barrel protein [Haliangium sp.]|uniref:outer membrane beta-barrel protein n=1 Tax=Haliangium sp. TaxID=2663208 RepID=UPI003D0D4B21